MAKPNGVVPPTIPGANSPVFPVEVPRATDITLSGDIQDLAKQMSDQELKALVIQMYRSQQEMLGYVRNMAQVFDAMSRFMPPGMPGGISNDV